MAEKKDEKVKLYVVIGLAVFAAVFAYFRFFHNKGGGKGLAVPVSGETVSGSFDLGEVEDVLARFTASEVKGRETPYRVIERDLFWPDPMAPPEETPDEVAPPPPAPDRRLELKGIMTGGARSLAIIDGRLLGEGDVVSGMTVRRVTARQVLLEGRGRRVVLTLEE